MGRKRRTLGWLIALGLAAAFFLCAGSIADAALSVRLLVGLGQLASGADAGDLAVVQARISRSEEGRTHAAVAYRPAAPPASVAVILAPGISELGCDHPRLAALSRILAHNGFFVLTPDIVPLREFRIAPEAMDEMLFWRSQVPSLEGAEQVQHTGLAGISFSGTLALIAAAQPELRDQVAFVLSIGGYENLRRCAQGWFAAGPITVGEGYYPTRYYARWIAMLDALDLVPDEGERARLETVLRNLLLQADVPDKSADFGEPASRWDRLARAREDESDAELAGQIIARVLQRSGERLSPAAAAREVRCPVFLAHGAFDDLIPPSESVELRKRITRAPSYLLISPFLTHTHPAEDKLSSYARVRASLEAYAFIYRLACTIR